MTHRPRLWRRSCRCRVAGRCPTCVEWRNPIDRLVLRRVLWSRRDQRMCNPMVSATLQPNQQGKSPAEAGLS